MTPTQGGAQQNPGCGGYPGPCPPPPKITDMKLDNSGCLGGPGRCGDINIRLNVAGCGGGPGPCPPVPKGCSGGPCPNTPAAGDATQQKSNTTFSPDTNQPTEAPGYYNAPKDSGTPGAKPVNKSQAYAAGV
jgi:hypothetical protein